MGPAAPARHPVNLANRTQQLDFGGKQGNAWLEYRLPAEQPRFVLDSYALTSANDEPARDPRHVVLEAYCEGARRQGGLLPLPSCKRV